jgi:hypothetical protein
MPREARRQLEADAVLNSQMPDAMHKAADELVILAYSTNRSPTRTARVMCYLSHLVYGSRTELDDFMERMQLEIAGGPVTSVSELLADARRLISRDERLRVTSPYGIRPHEPLTEAEDRQAREAAELTDFGPMDIRNPHGPMKPGA